MSSENEKVMIIQNEHEICFNSIIMKKVVGWSFQMESNKTKGNVKKQKLHVQKKMWKGHNRHAWCWYFYYVNNGKDVERGIPLTHEIYSLLQ